MTDQQMHERLQAAGARFREQTATTNSSADVEELLPGAGPRRSRLLVSVAAAAVVLLVVGLALGLRGSHRPTSPSGELAGLVGNVWLVSPDVRPSTAALYISRSGRLVADDECRVIGGTASVAGSRLTVTDVSVRFKPCADQYGAGFYDQGTRVLRGSAKFRIDSGGLTISRAGVGSLHFVLARTSVPAPSLDVPTLTGANWVAANGTVLRIDPGTGELSGGWCGGRAVLRGPAVRFTDCPAAGTASYTAVIAGITLRLTDRSHRHALDFQWRPSDPSIIAPGALTGRTWHLRSVVSSPASSGSLRIDGGTAVVDDGCDSYRRPVHVAAGTFSIAGGVPKYACTDQAMTADSFVFNSPATWTVRGGALIVYGGGSQALALVYGSAGHGVSGQNPAALLAHPWQVVTVRSGTGAYAQGAPTADPAALTLTRSGYTLGHTCYYRTGSAQLGPTTIRFGNGRSVPHSCPKPLNGNAQELAAQAIDKIVSGDVRWRITGALLTLDAAAGTLVLQPVGGRIADLVRSTWRLASVGGHPAIGDVTLSFPDDATLSITRCYTSQAGVEITTTSLGVRNLHVTKALPCPSGPPGTRPQNDLIDSVFQGTVSWSLHGARLTVGSGAHALVFTPRP